MRIIPPTFCYQIENMKLPKQNEEQYVRDLRLLIGHTTDFGQFSAVE